jgi:hypothetical protein
VNDDEYITGWNNHQIESIITHSLISSSPHLFFYRGLLLPPFLLSLSGPHQLSIINMHFSSLLASSLALISSGVFAAPSAQPHKLGKRCENSASDRSCWGDYDLSTDYYNEVPDTGVTREVSNSRSLNASSI